MTCQPLTACRACSYGSLSLVLSLGWLPMANAYLSIGSSAPLKYHPHEMLQCDACGLCQLGIIPDPAETFPPSYPYTSGTTKQLRDNFADLRKDVDADLSRTDFVLDIGGNDGTLLSNFEGNCRLNVTPEAMGAVGEAKGIPWLQKFWGKSAAHDALNKYGKAKIVTATNVFAHVADPGAFIEAVLSVLADDGLLVLEVQYLGDLIDGNQWDHIYAEHQLFWSLNALQSLVNCHGLFVRSVKSIPTHGGSVRVICDRQKRGVKLLEKPIGMPSLQRFAKRVAESKADLWSILSANHGAKIAGIGAPSRASTLVSYVGLDESIVRRVAETEGSQKIGKMMPGTRIPIVLEDTAALDADILLLFAHHLPDLAPKLKAKTKAKIVAPLPSPVIL